MPPDFKGRVLNCLLRAHSDIIVMQRSRFGPERPDTIFFQYPGFCNREREYVNTYRLTQEELKPRTLAFKLHDSTHTYNCVVNSLKRSGFRHTTASGWNVLWCGYTKGEFLKDLYPLQRVNHFPSTNQLGRKDLMWRNISRMRRLHGADYEIAPTTFMLPEDGKLFNLDR